VLIFDQPFRLYGAGGTRGLQATQKSIVLDLADQVSPVAIEFIGIKPSRGLAHLTTAPYSVVKVPWDDGAAPWNLRQAFWKELARWLVEQNRDVIVCCMGGHGRTGTALAILTHFIRPEISRNFRCVVSWLRKIYCDQAVETYEQIQYIELMTETKIIALPSWVSHGSGIYHYNSIGTEPRQQQMWWVNDTPTNPSYDKKEEIDEANELDEWMRDREEEKYQDEVEAMVELCEKCDSTTLEQCARCTVWQDWCDKNADRSM
jgi:hypothetical protein